MLLVWFLCLGVLAFCLVMMECPRCGFLQPPDRFCANCGLDIERYQAPKVPWHQQVLTSAPFHLALAAALLLAVVLFLYQARPPWESRPLRQPPVSKHDFSGQPDSSRGTVSVQAINAANTNQGAVDSPPSTSSPAEFQTVTAPSPQGLGEGTEDFLQEDITADAPATPPQRLSVRFYEMTNTDLQQALSLGFNVEDTPVTEQQVATSFTIDKELLEPFLQRARPLIGQSTGPYQESLQTIISQSLDLDILGLEGGPNQTVGLNMEVNLQNIRQNLTDVLLFTSITLPLGEIEESDPSWLSFQISTIKPLPWSSSLLIVGSVPYGRFLGLEEGLYEDGPLSILNSPSFANRQSELVILLTGEP